jgi:hypothetical protein
MVGQVVVWNLYEMLQNLGFIVSMGGHFSLHLLVLGQIDVGNELAIHGLAELLLDKEATDERRWHAEAKSTIHLFLYKISRTYFA